MAFVGLEDMQGVVDLVIFPKVWQKYQDLVQYDKVVIVDGRVDTQRGEPKILVETISTEGTWVTNADSQTQTAIDDLEGKPVYKSMPRPAAMQVAENNSNGWSDPDMPPPPDDWQVGPARESVEPNTKSEVVPETRNAEPAVEEKSEPPILEHNDQNAPGGEISPKAEPEESTPSPEDDPPDLDQDDTDVQSAAVSQMVVENDAVVVEQVVTAKSDESEAQVEQPPTKETGHSTEMGLAEQLVQPEPAPKEVPPRLTMPPLEAPPPSLLAADGAPRMLTVVLRSLEDRARDILRMRRVHGMLISYPGKDRFAFYVIERNRGYRLEFPNDSTSMNEELVARLEQVVGKENLIVEPITIQ
jgi:DNA polymerase-3 subunit alpha